MLAADTVDSADTVAALLTAKADPNIKDVVYYTWYITVLTILVLPQLIL